MARKTQDIYDLVMAALGSVPKPYTEDVIEDVFLRITGPLLERLECARTQHGREVTNQMIGRYVRTAVHGTAIKQVPATRTKLTGSYSKLSIGEK